MFRKCLLALAISIPLLMLPPLAALSEAGGGGTGKSATPDVFGLIIGVKGSAELKTMKDNPFKLDKDKHFMHKVKDGDKIRTNENGWALILSVHDGRVYEMASGALVQARGGELTSLRGNMRVAMKMESSIPDFRKKSAPLTVFNPLRKSCLKISSPTNTAIISTTPTLTWENYCIGSKKVTLKVLNKRAVIYEVITGDTSFKIPKDLLMQNSTYSWLIDGYPNDIIGGTFTVLDDSVTKEVLSLGLKYQQDKDNIAKRLDYIYLLIKHGLSEMAYSEVENLKAEYPNSPNIVLSAYLITEEEEKEEVEEAPAAPAKETIDLD